MSDSEDQCSKAHALREKAIRRKMRRSSHLFTSNNSSSLGLNPPQPKYIKSEYGDKLEKEIEEWMNFIPSNKKHPPKTYVKKEMDASVLQCDQQSYIQSYVSTTNWLKESEDFRKKVQFYLKFNEYHQQKNFMAENIAQHQNLDSFVFDSFTNGFGFESVK